MIVGVPLMAVICDVVGQLIFYEIKKHGMGEMIDHYNTVFHPKTKNDKGEAYVR